MPLAALILLAHERRIRVKEVTQRMRAKAPPGYTRGMQDPKHRGQMLRSPIKDTWIAAEKLEMEGLARRKCWVRVMKSTLTAQDKVFSTRFHYKIKRKHGQFEKCKVRLVVQGQHMHRILKTISARYRIQVASV